MRKPPTPGVSPTASPSAIPASPASRDKSTNALTRIDAALAGRAFAAYGGIYIVSSLVWMVVVERTAPRITDYVGAAVCLAGAGIILYGARWTAA